MCVCGCQCVRVCVCQCVRACVCVCVCDGLICALGEVLYLTCRGKFFASCSFQTKEDYLHQRWVTRNKVDFL
jgi:hypothetical protein